VTARRAAEPRAEHRSLRLPDPVSLAAALSADSELLTLDNRLRQIAGRVQAVALARTSESLRSCPRC